MPGLAIYRGDQFDRRVDLGDRPIRIGRASENDLVLDDREKGVSRAHAEIRQERGRYVIVDLNSQNGVWLGDRRVKHEPLPLDTPVTIGPYRLVLESEPPDTAPAAQSQITVSRAAIEETEFAEPTQMSLAALPPPPAPTEPPPASGPRKRVPRAALVGGAAVIAAGLVIAVLVRKPAPAGPQNPVTPPPVQVLPTQPTPEDRFVARLKEAQAHFDKGEKAEAQKALDEALAILPGDVRATVLGAQVALLPAAENPEGQPPGPVIDTATGGPTSPKKREVNVFLTANSRPGERGAEFASREKQVRQQFDEGKRLFEDRQYARAIPLLQSAMTDSDRQEFGSYSGEAQELITKARDALAKIAADDRSRRVQGLIDEAKKAAPNDVVVAIKLLRSARALDPTAPEISQLMKAFEDQARREGESAFVEAKNLHAKSRIEPATRLFERAVQLWELLPEVHKNLEVARARLLELRAAK